MSLLEQLMKDRATWASNQDKEYKEKELKIRQRFRASVVYAGILLVLAVLVIFNYSLIITGLSKLIVAI